MSRQDDRPEPFSTYVPRTVVRRLKVVAVVTDVPLWSLVTTAVEQFLERYEHEHGALPDLATAPSSNPTRRR